MAEASRLAKVRRAFDDAARLGRAQLDWSGPITKAALEAAAPDRHTRTLIDVGCGEAPAYLDGAGQWPGVTVVLGDVSSGALRHARAAQRPVVQFAAEALPFTAGAVERIVCVCMLAFAADPLAVLAEFARVLDRSHGRLVVAELTRQRDPSTAFVQELLAEELARGGPGTGGRLRDVLPPLRRLADLAGLTVVSSAEQWFATPLTDSEQCWRWFLSTHRTAVATLAMDRVSRLRDRVVEAAGRALADGPLCSTQGAVLTVLEPRHPGTAERR